jgi:hypothetical protein
MCLRACETQGRSGQIRQRQPFRLDAAQNNVYIVAGGELDVFFLRKRFASAILQECVAGKMKEKKEKGRLIG